MAKATKKVSKKKVSKKVKPEGLSAQEQAIDEVIDQLSDDDVEQVIDADAATKAAHENVSDAKGGDEPMAKVTIPVHLKIKRKNYPPGVHTVPKHQVPLILEMVHKKRTADLSMFTGKNYIVQRLLDRTLVISEEA